MNKLTKHNRKSRKNNKKTLKQRKHRLYRKQRQINIVPGSSRPIFEKPEIIHNNSIINNFDKIHGNIVPGLKNYLRR